MSKTAVRATIRHDLETWHAQLGQPLRGLADDGRKLSAREVVVGIYPDQLTLHTTGGANWSQIAQVHGMSDVHYVDMEQEDVLGTDGPEVVEARRSAGWELYQELQLIDEAERVRLLFTRRWREPAKS